MYQIEREVSAISECITDGRFIPQEITLNVISGLGHSQSVYNGELFESTWGLGWNIKGNKKDDCGMLRSPSAYEHGGYGWYTRQHNHCCFYNEDFFCPARQRKEAMRWHCRLTTTQHGGKKTVIKMANDYVVEYNIQ